MRAINSQDMALFFFPERSSDGPAIIPSMQIDFRLFERYSFAILLAVLVGVSGCRKFPVESEETSEPNPDELTVAVNTRFLLNHGDFVRLGDTGLEVHFENVLEDNRCPSESICGRFGRAGIRLIVTEEGARDSEIVMYIPGEVEVPYEENGAVFFRGRYFRLLALEPYPFSDTSIPESSYQALLRIEQPK